MTAGFEFAARVCASAPCLSVSYGPFSREAIVLSWGFVNLIQSIGVGEFASNGFLGFFPLMFLECVLLSMVHIQQRCYWYTLGSKTKGRHSRR